MVRCSMVWHVMVFCGMAWDSMVWYGMVCYDRPSSDVELFMFRAKSQMLMT